jgi:hypothetical protein
MNIDKRWIFLAMAAGALGSVAAALTSRRGSQRTARAVDLKTGVKSWENEGGNLSPAQGTAPASSAP